MKTLIVSAFPACGKTHYHIAGDKYDSFSTKDSDSSSFSWILDENGNSKGIRNPEFPANYIQHIKDNIGKVNFIFVSSHDEVRQALEDNLLPYVTVMPQRNAKDEWINRCVKRGNDEKFISLLEKMWDNWTSFESQQRWDPIGRLFLKDDQYISDVIFTLDTYRDCEGIETID